MGQKKAPNMSSGRTSVVRVTVPWIAVSLSTSSTQVANLQHRTEVEERHVVLARFRVPTILRHVVADCLISFNEIVDGLAQVRLVAVKLVLNTARKNRLVGLNMSDVNIESRGFIHDHLNRLVDVFQDGRRLRGELRVALRLLSVIVHRKTG